MTSVVNEESNAQALCNLHISQYSLEISWILDKFRHYRHLCCCEKGVTEAEWYHWENTIPSTNGTNLGYVIKSEVVYVACKYKTDREEQN